MPSIRLGGYKSARDFWAKARHELKRFKNADEQRDRADHALNADIMVHRLRDWTYHHGMQLGLAMGDSRNFLGNARNANGSVKLLRKIADTTKHHNLVDRKVLKNQVFSFGEGKRIIKNLCQNVCVNDVGRFLRVRTGNDALRVMYMHGVNAVEKTKDRTLNTTIDLGNSTRSLQ